MVSMAAVVAAVRDSARDGLPIKESLADIDLFVVVEGRE
jgi:hypothetical protein